ncbi:hypothetical protein Tco_1118343 [Tanacetum coccineum]
MVTPSHKDHFACQCISSTAMVSRLKTSTADEDKGFSESKTHEALLEIRQKGKERCHMVADHVLVKDQSILGSLTCLCFGLQLAFAAYIYSLHLQLWFAACICSKHLQLAFADKNKLPSFDKIS